MTVVEWAERKVGLLKQAIDIVNHLRANESEHQHLLRLRDVSCRELKAAGASIKELQETFGVSRSRVQQILSDASEQALVLPGQDVGSSGSGSSPR